MVHDTNGNEVKKPAAEVLIHEIVGHAAPTLAGSETGNAVKNENIVRRELGLPERIDDKVWTERKTIFINKTKIDSILDKSVTDYYGIGCGYGRCREIHFFSNHQFKKIDVSGDTIYGKWKLEGELLTIRYDRRHKGHKRNYKYIIKYREKDYPTIFLFTKKFFDCQIFCNYK